jgi:hypothetical protein
MRSVDVKDKKSLQIAEKFASQPTVTGGFSWLGIAKG